MTGDDLASWAVSVWTPIFRLSLCCHAWQVRGKTVYLQYSTRQEIVNSTRSVEQGGNVLLVSLENLGVRSQALICSLASSPSLQNGNPLLCSTSAPFSRALPHLCKA